MEKHENEIKQRLVKLITNEKITAAIFADNIGVQRSTISHILSGRNKPSLDFLQKILIKYPKYSAEWLINGNLPMLKALVYQPTIFDTINPNNDTAKENKEKTNEFTHVNSKFNTNPPNDIQNINNLKVEKEKNEINNNLNTDINIDKYKKVERIAIFYTDGTFNIYKPS